ncbi:hypothetical protein C900_03846 [Fulvivirga imtechensis AK7]|uniref:histidine kinase n=1 Tax=Fulvivirga imtechensis AK7 TaxID=1237149 RepID=L8JML4_9BACT|nr:PAS domain S-box protein [Fulvivirga imtechensis]ELR70161.1 hypothetical protein C900_03846 [Fulvivirga imtechensis AK7]
MKETTRGKQTHSLNFKSIFDHAPTGMVLLSSAGEILQANILFCRLLKFEEGELLYKNLHDFIHPDDLILYQEREQSLVNGEEAKLEMKVRFRIRDAYVLVNYHASLIPAADGEPACQHGQLVELPHSADDIVLLNALMEHFPGSIYFKDRLSRFLKINKAFEKKFGLSREDIIGKSDFDLFTDEHAEQAFDDERRIMQTGRPMLNQEEKETWPDGHITWVASTKMPLYNQANELIGTFGISTDITEKKTSEIEIKEKTSILNAITSKMPVVIYKYYGNKKLDILLGAPKLKTDFKKSKIIKLSIAEGLSSLVEKISAQKDKNEYLHFASATQNRYFENYVFEGQPEKKEYIGLALDVTDNKISKQKLKKNAKELEKINRELNQFAYIISHDLKAPLRAITNLSEWIEEDLEEVENDDVKDNLKLLRIRVHRMESLINGILAYSRVSRGDIVYEEIDTHKLVKDLVDSLMVPEKFNVKISDKLPVIMFPRVNLEQLFSNLVSNAVKYHDKPEGRIDIGYKELPEWHEFFVADDGPGIAPEYHEKIFVIFQTLQARDNVESTGIGLTIVKKIIEDRGGSIKVDSAEGKGTRFIFRLPKAVVNNEIK